MKIRLSSHQDYYMRLVASGRLVLVFDHDRKCFVSAVGEGKFWNTIPSSKPIGRRGPSYFIFGHLNSSIIELRQRGLLVSENDRLVPSREARKIFGYPPIKVQPRQLKMSRTRAARVQ
jgi:hypothetical protein